MRRRSRRGRSALLCGRRGRQHPALFVAGAARLRRRHRGISRRRGAAPGDERPRARPRVPQHLARIRRRHRVGGHARQARLSRRRAIDEQSRRGGARSRQEHRRRAQAQHAAGAQEAIRDRRGRQDPPGAQARHAGAPSPPGSTSTRRSTTNGSSSGISRKSICARNSSPARKPMPARAIRNMASCCPARSCRARRKRA